MARLDLPDGFREKMRALLGAEYGEYEDSLVREQASGLRVNTWRLGRRGISPAAFAASAPWPLRPVPWTDNGFYYGEEGRPSRDPYYFAGLYYLQEPSAMCPAAMLPVRPGDRVLDLCAAPGGKSTELGSRLRGRGVLVANDISSSRAKALLKNLEMWGIGNAYVSTETPERLAAAFPECFDRILVDAPCSGEGMFRKDPEMVKSWRERGPEAYVPIQRDILTHAADMLAPGGLLLYSTCTFDCSEDEGQMEWLLAQRPDLELVPLPAFEGASPGIGLEGCLRLFPHKVEGEGHFLAMVGKRPACGTDVSIMGEERRGDRMLGRDAGMAGDAIPGGLVPEEARNFLSHVRMDFSPDTCLASSVSRFYQKLDGRAGGSRDWAGRGGDSHGCTSLYYLPESLGVRPGIRYLRTGLWLGDVKKGRFEPSQALAMALSPETFDRTLNLTRGDERVVRYLKGETIPVRDGEDESDGWRLVCVDGFPLGFAKGERGRLKNKYQPGWRWQ